MIDVRLASVGDAERAWRIVDEYNESIGVVARDDRAHFKEYLQAPHAFWLAERDGVVIGCVALRAIPHVSGRACEVKRLYVRPEYRRHGIAAKLMDTLEGYARSMRFEAVYLDTFEDLAAAVRFYELRGYERIPRYNANVQATIFMRKLL